MGDVEIATINGDVDRLLAQCVAGQDVGPAINGGVHPGQVLFVHGLEQGAVEL